MGLSTMATLVGSAALESFDFDSEMLRLRPGDLIRRMRSSASIKTSGMSAATTSENPEIKVSSSDSCSATSHLSA
jgi:hypothetical protein